MLSFEMIFWGKTNTGKTQLLNRIFNNSYDEKKRAYKFNTLDFSTEKNDGVRYQLWDFPDSDKDAAPDLLPVHAKADVILYCVDLTLATNDNIMNKIMSELLCLNKEKGNKTEIILVATKNDTDALAKISKANLKALNLALNGINIKQFVVSAKQNTGIDELKNYLFNRAKTQEQPIEEYPTINDVMQLQQLCAPILQKFSNEISKLPKHKKQGMEQALDQFRLSIMWATQPAEIDKARDCFIKKTNNILQDKYLNMAITAAILAGVLAGVAMLMLAFSPGIAAFVVTGLVLVPAWVGMGFLSKIETPWDKATINEVKDNITEEINKLNAPEP